MKKKLMSIVLAAGMIAAMVAPSVALAAETSASAGAQVVEKVAKVHDLEAEREGSYVELDWDKVSGADGYRVYRATSKSGTYTRLVTLSGASKDEYIDKTASSSKTYYYKVRAFEVTSSGAKKFGAYSSIVSVKAIAKLGKVYDLEAEREGKKHIELDWDDVAGAEGYRVYRSTSKSSGFTRIATLKGGSIDEYHDKSSSLVSGKKYYYKVRAYRVVNGKYEFGAYSSVVSAKA